MNATTAASTTTLSSLRAPMESNLPAVAPGFASLQSFELMQRTAKLLSNSTLVPAQYRAFNPGKKDKYGNVQDWIENPNAVPNCVVALNMALRQNADPLMVMQNLYIVEGRPAWSSQWVIAAINSCGRFAPLRYDKVSRGKKTVEYKSTYWENNERQTRVSKIEIDDEVCIAWTVEKGVEIPRFSAEQLRNKTLLQLCRENGVPVIESPAVSMEMAIKEGWYSKNGSKWQTMPDVMLRYRSASFFGRLYAPELLMGLQTDDEVRDTLEARQSADGSTISVDVEALRREASERAQAERGMAVPKHPDATDLPVTESSSAPAENSAQHTAADETGAAPVADEAQAGGSSVDIAHLEQRLRAATDVDMLDADADLIRDIPDSQERTRLETLYQQLRQALTTDAAPTQPQRTQRRRMAAPE